MSGIGVSQIVQKNIGKPESTVSEASKDRTTVSCQSRAGDTRVSWSYHIKLCL